jgi:hypothetical protein
MAKIRTEELDQLAGEVLPERTVLSAMPADPSSAAPFSPFCSQNNESSTVAGSVIATQASNNQCGLTNDGEANAFAGLIGLGGGMRAMR